MDSHLGQGRKTTLKTGITMEQKTIWTHFLIVGISLITVILKSCNNETVEPIKTIQYVYHNTTDTNLVMEIYNQSRSLIKSYEIVPNNQIITNTTKVEAPALFYYDFDINDIGDSIAVKFTSNKCLFFVKNKGGKIFTVTEYDNYNEELLKKNEYQLIYSFKQTDLNQASDCD